MGLFTFGAFSSTYKRSNCFSWLSEACCTSDAAPREQLQQQVRGYSSAGEQRGLSSDMKTQLDSEKEVYIAMKYSCAESLSCAHMYQIKLIFKERTPRCF